MGYWRLLLAIMVVFAHLSPDLFPGVGSFAVFSFYVVSGYLITKVINTRYRDGLAGLRRFALNRILRLYPVYYCTLTMSAAAIWLHPALALQLNDSMRFPESPYGVFAQLAVFGLLKPNSLLQLDPNVLYWVRMVPVAWSLNMELIFYGFIALLGGRGKWACLIWLLASGVAFVHLLIASDVRLTYFTLLGPSICFSVGAALHFVEASPRLEFLRRWASPALCAYFAFVVLAGTPSGQLLGLEGDGSAVHNALLLCSIPLSAVILYNVARGDLSGATASRASPGSFRKRAEALAADLSYPVFLVHWPVSVFVCAALFADAAMGLPLALMTLLASALVSLALVLLVERPVHGLRRRIQPTDKTGAGAVMAVSPTPFAGGRRSV